MRQRQQGQRGTWTWVRRLCGLRSDQQVLLSMSWPPLVISVPDVRHAVTQVCPGNQTLVLLASELATNAVQHAQTWFRVELRTTKYGLRLSIYDQNPARLPSPASGGAFVDPLAERGRGLLLVSNLTRHWGVAMSDEGKTVWLDLPAGEGSTVHRSLLV